MTFLLGPSFDQPVSLEDGSVLHLRWIRPADAPLLRDTFSRLSMRSRMMRFFVPLHTLSDDSVRYLTEVDGVHHAALLALSIPGGAVPEERSFGVARFIRSAADPKSAEAAVAVTDDAQGHGLGRRLIETLAIAARERGVETFEANVLWSNARVHAFLQRRGAVRRRREGEFVEYGIDTAALAAVPTAPPASHPCAAPLPGQCPILPRRYPQRPVERPRHPPGAAEPAPLRDRLRPELRRRQ